MRHRRCSLCGGFTGCECQGHSRDPDLFFRKMAELTPAPVPKGDMPQVGLLKKTKKKKKDTKAKPKPKEPCDDGGFDLESVQSSDEEEGEKGDSLPAGQPDKQPDNGGMKTWQVKTLWQHENS